MAHYFSHILVVIWAYKLFVCICVMFLLCRLALFKINFFKHGSKPFNTLTVFLREFFEKKIGKRSADDISMKKYRAYRVEELLGLYQKKCHWGGVGGWNLT